jgi:hypothetical protein
VAGPPEPSTDESGWSTMAAISEPVV